MHRQTRSKKAGNSKRRVALQRESKEQFERSSDKEQAGAEGPSVEFEHATQSFDKEQVGAEEPSVELERATQSIYQDCSGDLDLPELPHLTISVRTTSEDAPAQSTLDKGLPHVDDLVVKTSNGYRAAKNHELFRVSNDRIMLLELKERKVAVVCGCDVPACTKYVQVGTHGKYALDASKLCPHCQRGPFAGESVANVHWKTKGCILSRMQPASV